MARCYVKHDNDIVDVTGNDAYNNQPCSNATGVQQCCANNSQCGRDGFCYFTHQLDAAVTGYYLGGCIDPNFEAPACPQHCTGLPTQDVIYNTTNGLWACCYGSGELNCNQPSDETFYAPNPQAVLVLSSAAPSSTSAAPSSSKTSTSTRTSSTTSSMPTPTESNSDDSSRTTTIAVATVIPIVVIAAAVGIFFWLLKRKLRKRREAQSQPDPGPGMGPAPVWSSGRQEAAYYKTVPDDGRVGVHELPGDQHRVELSPASRRSELKGS